MNKRGQALEVSSALIMLGITLFSVFSVINESNSIYFGNKNEKTYYSYEQCKEFFTEKDEGFILFKSEQEAIQLGYNKNDRCPEKERTIN